MTDLVLLILAMWVVVVAVALIQLEIQRPGAAADDSEADFRLRKLLLHLRQFRLRLLQLRLQLLVFCHQRRLGLFRLEQRLLQRSQLYRLLALLNECLQGRRHYRRNLRLCGLEHLEGLPVADALLEVRQQLNREFELLAKGGEVHAGSSPAPTPAAMEKGGAK